MNQFLSFQQLNDRLVRIEKKMGLIHKELADLRQQTRWVPQAITGRFAVASL
ncbi:MAG: hypothetical protein ONB05_02365 [candidate division KSB1 bacterium]|nr:hypothetical protein [candidate division KSB1 bacterium]